MLLFNRTQPWQVSDYPGLDNGSTLEMFGKGARLPWLCISWWLDCKTDFISFWQNRIFITDLIRIVPHTVK